MPEPTSSPENGSSRRTRSGLCMSAADESTFWRIPFGVGRRWERDGRRAERTGAAAVDAFAVDCSRVDRAVGRPW